jgi:virginiamycin B lyase
MVMNFRVLGIRRLDRDLRRRFGAASGRSRRPAARLQVEGLEPRCLLTINQFPIPTFQSSPLDIAAGLNGQFFEGNLWFTEDNGNKLGEITTAGAITEFTTPATNGSPRGITRGPDGDLWFTDPTGNGTGKIGRMTTAGAFNETNTPVGTTSFLTVGPDGNLWYTIDFLDAIGEINPSTMSVTDFTLPTAGASPRAITTGPDGNLWFAEAAANQIGLINPRTHTVREFPIPTAGSDPSGIATGPDGNLWFTEALSNKIGRITTAGVITEFSVPTANGSPGGISAGPGGTLFFTDAGAHAIGGINPTTGKITEFPLPPSGQPGELPAITLGPDGNIWFPETGSNVIGELVLAAPPTTAPDLTLSGNAATSVTLGQNVTYTLTVTNNGAAAATGVTLADTLPSGANFVSATGGISPVGGVLTFALGDLAAGASAALTIVITPSAAGTLSNSATVSMDQADSTPADNRITLNTSVTVTPAARAAGPTIVSVQLVGSHRRAMAIVLTFDEPLDPARAQNLANFQLVALKGRGAVIRIKSARYDPAARAVTLKPVHRLDPHRRYRLTIKGTGPGGISDTSGNLLDGQKTGNPGSDFTTILVAADIVRAS